jgi:peptidoglycan-N-acetylglucosamine deacetylase
VRRIFAEGHTIGTHSEDHPVRFGKLPPPLVEWEIDKGILDVGSALGDHRQVAPFFVFRDWRARTLSRVSLRLECS